MNTSQHPSSSVSFIILTILSDQWAGLKGQSLGSVKTPSAISYLVHNMSFQPVFLAGGQPHHLP